MTFPTLRVYWFRSVPATKTEHFECETVREALAVLERETFRDLLDPNVTDNGGGLEVFEDGDWCEYYDAEGRDAWELIEEREEQRRNAL